MASFESEPEILELHDRLVAAGTVWPLALGGAEEALWCNCDLASLAENRLGDKTDPRALDDARREEWRLRAGTEQCLRPSQRQFERCFWLLENGETVGTVALSSLVFGSLLIGSSSFYVLPTHRGRGVGARALSRLRELLAAHQRGIRLDTYWTWQSAVAFYLRQGFWLRRWKRDLTFQRHRDAPPAIVQVGDRVAHVTVDFDGRRAVLARAERAGDRTTGTRLSGRNAQNPRASLPNLG